MRVNVGEMYLVFDADTWTREGDVGDNSCYHKPARIIRTYRDKSGNELADVEFANGSRSRGHFVSTFRMRLVDA